MIIFIYKYLQKHKINLNIFYLYRKNIKKLFLSLLDKDYLNSKDIQNMFYCLIEVSCKKKIKNSIINNYFKFLNYDFNILYNIKKLNKESRSLYDTARFFYRQCFFLPYRKDKHLLMEKLFKKYTDNDFNKLIDTYNNLLNISNNNITSVFENLIDLDSILSYLYNNKSLYDKADIIYQKYLNIFINESYKRGDIK